MEPTNIPQDFSPEEQEYLNSIPEGNRQVVLRKVQEDPGLLPRLVDRRKTIGLLSDPNAPTGGTREGAEALVKQQRNSDLIQDAKVTGGLVDETKGTIAASAIPMEQKEDKGGYLWDLTTRAIPRAITGVPVRVTKAVSEYVVSPVSQAIHYMVKKANEAGVLTSVEAISDEDMKALIDDYTFSIQETEDLISVKGTFEKPITMPGAIIGEGLPQALAFVGISKGLAAYGITSVTASVLGRLGVATKNLGGVAQMATAFTDFVMTSGLAATIAGGDDTIIRAAVDAWTEDPQKFIAWHDSLPAWQRAGFKVADDLIGGAMGKALIGAGGEFMKTYGKTLGNNPGTIPYIKEMLQGWKAGLNKALSKETKSAVVESLQKIQPAAVVAKETTENLVKEVTPAAPSAPPVIPVAPQLPAGVSFETHKLVDGKWTAKDVPSVTAPATPRPKSSPTISPEPDGASIFRSSYPEGTVVVGRRGRKPGPSVTTLGVPTSTVADTPELSVVDFVESIFKEADEAIVDNVSIESTETAVKVTSAVRKQKTAVVKPQGPVQLDPVVTPKTPVSEVQPVSATTSIISNRTIKRVNDFWSPVEVRLGHDSWIRVENPMDADVIEVMAKLELYPEISGLKKDKQKLLFKELDEVMKTYGMTMDDVDVIYKKYAPSLDKLVETTEQLVDGVKVQKKRWKLNQTFSADKKRGWTVDSATGLQFRPNIKIRQEMLKRGILSGVPPVILPEGKPLTHENVLDVIRQVMSGDFSGISDDMLLKKSEAVPQVTPLKGVVADELPVEVPVEPKVIKTVSIKKATAESKGNVPSATQVRAPSPRERQLATTRESVEVLKGQLKDMKKSKAPKEDIAQTTRALKIVQQKLFELEATEAPLPIPKTAKDRIAAMKEAAEARKKESVPQEILDAQEELDVSVDAMADMKAAGSEIPESLTTEIRKLQEKVAPYSSQIQKLRNPRSGSSMVPVEGVVSGLKAIVDKFNSPNPGLFVEAASFLGMPLVASIAANVTDGFIGEDNYDTSTYLGLFAALTAVKAGVGLKRTLGMRRMVKDVAPELMRLIHDQNVSMVSVLKTIQQNLPPDQAKQLFDGVADDILSQTYTIGDKIIKKILKDSENALTAISGFFDSGLNIPEDIMSGTARGTAKVVHPAMFDHPALQIEAMRGLSKNFKDAITKRGPFLDTAEGAIHDRLKRAQAHYGISPEATSKLGEIFGLDMTSTLDAYSFLLTADSVESAFLGKLKGLTKGTTPATIASALESFAQFRMFHELLVNPENAFNSTTMNDAQEFLMKSRALGYLIDSEQTTGTLGQKWLKSGYQALAKIKKLSDMGNEGRHLLFNFMRQLPGDPSTWDTVVIGMYNALLSGPLLLTTTAVSNLGGQALLMGNQAIRYTIGKLTKDVRLAGGSREYLGHYTVDNIGTALKNFFLTAKTGVNVFDPLSARDSTRRALDNMAINLGDPKGISTFFMRSLRGMSDAVGATGASIVAGLDAFSQTLTHGARLKQLVYQNAYDNLVTSGQKGVTDEQVATYIINKMEKDPAWIAQFSDQAMLQSRMSAYQASPTKAQWSTTTEQGTVSVPGHGLMAKGFESVAEFHGKSTIGNLLAPFLSSSMRSHAVGLEYSPFGIFDDMITPSSTLRQWKRSGFAGMSEAQKAIAKDELLDMGTKTTTGLMFAMGTYGILDALDVHIVMPGEDSDVEIKKKTGANGGDIVFRTPNGDYHTIKTRMHTWLLPSLHMVNQAGRWWRGSPLEEDLMDSQRGWLTVIGTLFSAGTSDTKAQFVKMYSKVHEVMSKGDGEELLNMVFNQWISAASRFDPTYIRELSKRTDGFLSASRTRGGRQKLDFLGEPTEVTPIGPVEMIAGSKEITPGSALRTALARSGVDTKTPPRFSWQGEPITDKDLLQKLQVTFGTHMKNAANSLVSMLNAHPVEDREAIARDIVSKFKDRAIADNYGDIHKWNLRRQLEATESLTDKTRKAVDRLLGGIE